MHFWLRAGQTCQGFPFIALACSWTVWLLNIIFIWLAISLTGLREGSFWTVGQVRREAALHAPPQMAACLRAVCAVCHHAAPAVVNPCTLCSCKLTTLQKWPLAAHA